MSNLIKRTYRITKDQDKLVKKASRKNGGESETVRLAIEALLSKK